MVLRSEVYTEFGHDASGHSLCWSSGYRRDQPCYDSRNKQSGMHDKPGEMYKR